MPRSALRRRRGRPRGPSRPGVAVACGATERARRIADTGDRQRPARRREAYSPRGLRDDGPDGVDRSPTARRQVRASLRQLVRERNPCSLGLGVERHQRGTLGVEGGAPTGRASRPSATSAMAASSCSSSTAGASPPARAAADGVAFARGARRVRRGARVASRRGLAFGLGGGEIVVGDGIVRDRGRMRVGGRPADRAGLAVHERRRELARVTAEATLQQTRRRRSLGGSPGGRGCVAVRDLGDPEFVRGQLLRLAGRVQACCQLVASRTRGVDACRVLGARRPARGRAAPARPGRERAASPSPRGRPSMASRARRRHAVLPASPAASSASCAAADAPHREFTGRVVRSPRVEVVGARRSACGDGSGIRMSARPPRRPPSPWRLRLLCDGRRRAGHAAASAARARSQVGAVGGDARRGGCRA